MKQIYYNDFWEALRINTYFPDTKNITAKWDWKLICFLKKHLYNEHDIFNDEHEDEKSLINTTQGKVYLDLRTKIIQWNLFLSLIFEIQFSVCNFVIKLNELNLFLCCTYAFELFKIIMIDFSQVISRNLEHFFRVDYYICI